VEAYFSCSRLLIATCQDQLVDYEDDGVSKREALHDRETTSYVTCVGKVEIAEGSTDV
jgi:hypothetical protein